MLLYWYLLITTLLILRVRSPASLTSYVAVLVTFDHNPINKQFRYDLQLLDVTPISLLISALYHTTRMQFQALETQLEASEASLKGLIRNQIDLKEDIRIKTKSLHIDKDLCQDLRATIDYSDY